MSESFPVIAIDGTAASGKSTVARALAAKLSFVYVDTGAMYRAVTWMLLHEGVEASDATAVEAALSKTRVTCWIQDGRVQLRVNDQDTTDFLRLPEVNASVSWVAAVPRVRTLLVDLQRQLAHQAPLVMEGRDIGTAVFPETPYKFFFDAHPDLRASRRRDQGEMDAIARRDAIDSSRAASPLACAPDAFRMDSGATTVEEMIEAIFEVLRQKGLKQAPPALRPSPTSAASI